VTAGHEVRYRRNPEMVGWAYPTATTHALSMTSTSNQKQNWVGDNEWTAFVVGCAATPPTLLVGERDPRMGTVVQGTYLAQEVNPRFNNGHLEINATNVQCPTMDLEDARNSSYLRGRYNFNTVPSGLYNNLYSRTRGKRPSRGGKK
jgi:hypothetical protein